MDYNSEQVYIPPELLKQAWYEVQQETPEINESVKWVMIDTKVNVITIIKDSEKKEITNQTREELKELDRIQYTPVITEKAKKELLEWENKSEEIKNKFKEINDYIKLDNLDIFLNDPYKKIFIEEYLNKISWRLDKDNNIIIWEIIINKWTKKYNYIMIDILNDLSSLLKILHVDKYERKSSK